MGEELSLDNILGAEEIDNLFVEDDVQETPPPSKDDGEDSSEKNSDNKEKKETTEVDVDTLFTHKQSSSINQKFIADSTIFESTFSENHYLYKLIQL